MDMVFPARPRSEAPDVHAGAGGCLTVDLNAVRANYEALARRVQPAGTAAVVKADAYGLGAARIGPAIAQAGCRQFFVASLAEAVSLRPQLPGDATIYVLNGLQPGSERLCIQTGTVPVLNSLEQVRCWVASAAGTGRALPAALQIDSGMSRLGLDQEEIDILRQDPAWLDRVPLTLIMSHLACPDQPEHAANDLQLSRFTKLASRLPAAPLSLGNSGSAFLPPRFHLDLVRLGVSLYGVGAQAGSPNPMHPVVRLEGRVIQVRTIPAGTGVGYGLSFRADRAARIATVGLGYADGWPRHLSNRGAAFVDGVRLPIAGRVSMDSMAIDATALPEGRLRLGEYVELIGPSQSLEDVASDAGTIPYEILTSLGRRYARTYLDSHIMKSPESSGCSR